MKRFLVPFDKLKRMNEPSPVSTKKIGTVEKRMHWDRVSKPRVTRQFLDQCDRIGPKDSHVYILDEATVIKVGDHVRLAEAEAMRIVRATTSIPVPEILDAYILDGTEHMDPPYGCIVMDCVDGEPLDDSWPSLTPLQKESLIEELRGYLKELHSAESVHVSSVDGSWCNDPFFSDELGAYGPFDSEASFKDGLVQAVLARDDNSWSRMVARFIQSLPIGKVVLTHNDIAPRNILVKDGKIVALLDWENAGYYPQYWEYVKALYWPKWNSPWITEGIVDKILDPYTTELALLLHAREIIW